MKKRFNKERGFCDIVNKNKKKKGRVIKTKIS